MLETLSNPVLLSNGEFIFLIAVTTMLGFIVGYFCRDKD